MLKHLETSIPGMVCLFFGVMLFLYGTHSPESLVSAGACVAAGVGLLKAADARHVTGQKEDNANNSAK
jgi:hypothetical protein